MYRWTYRCSLLVTALATVVGLSTATMTRAPTAVNAAGTVNVVRHLGGAVNAVYATANYLLWGKGAELEVYSADGANRLGGLLLPALIGDIDVDGTTAYVAASDGLYLVNIANLAQPSLSQHIPARAPLEEFESVSSVVGLGSHAYMGLEDGGLWTVDLAAAAQQSAEAQVVQAPAHHYVSELYHFGSYLFSVDNSSGSPGQPQVWDLSNPGAPAFLGKINTRSDASGVAVASGHLFISTFYEGLAIYNWNPADPLTATLAGSLPVGFGAYDLALTADSQRAVLATDAGLAYVNVSNRASPVQLDVEPAPVGYYSRIATAGGLVFAAGGEAGLHVYGFDASSLTFVRERGLRGSQMAGVQVGSDLFVAGYSEGLSKLAVGNPSSPAVTGRQPSISLAQTVAAAGGYVVVGDDGDVVVVDPASLAELGRVTLPDGNRGRSLAASGDTVFVAAGHAGLCVVGVAGGEPKLHSCFDTPGEALDVALDGTRAYVADGDGVEVVEVSNPQSLQSLGRYTGAQAMEVAVVGSQLFVSDANDGNGRLLVLNRGAGASLNFATQYDTRGLVDDIEVSGSLVYLANQEGLEVLQRISPSSLAEWAWYPSAGSALDVVVNGSHVYLMDGVNGLVVLTVSAPTDPPPTPNPDVGDYQVMLPLVVR